MMDAEKNVVEAARKLLKLIQPNAVGGFDVTGNLHDELRELMGAIAAYDSAPAPSEDRVREACHAAFAACHVVGFLRDGTWDRMVEALKSYVTPAPALPPGTVAVSVETLKKLRMFFVNTITNGGYPMKDAKEAEQMIDAILPPPPRPEPPKELVAEWERMATKYVRDLMLGGPDAAFLEHSPHVMRAYVDALRAAWEDNPERKP